MSLSVQDLEELDPDFIMAKQVEQLEKEKKELQERLKNQEKKVRVLDLSFYSISFASVFPGFIFHMFVLLASENWILFSRFFF